MIRPDTLKIICFLLFILLPGCKKRKQPTPPASYKSIPTPHLITTHPKTKHQLMVFVHGTILPIPSLECFGSALHTFLAKGRTLKKSWYQLYLDKLKQNSLFKYQPSGPEGLCSINNTSCTLTAQITQAIFSDLYEELYPNTQLHCYTFGWSGRLSHRKRVQAAHTLYQQLIKECHTRAYENYSVVLVGHSHGGNVILNLALAEEKYKQNLIIEKTILLGTPMQSETEPLLTSPIFTKVYSLYSHGDNIQKIDILSTKDDFSRRRFSTTPNTPATTKLVEIELEVGALKPGHSELWLYNGKQNPVYRKKMPVNPFPILVFLPEMIKKLEDSPTQHHDILVHLDSLEKNYTMNFYDKTQPTNNPHHLLSSATIDPKYFAPYLQTIIQN